MGIMPFAHSFMVSILVAPLVKYMYRPSLSVFSTV
jgi:hypothetical protein